MSAKIILDSQHPNGGRLTTMVLRIPTCVLAQFNTHRWFSKNAASMRAIPTTRVLQDVLKDPYVPEWTSNKPGMQGGDTIRWPRLATKAWVAALYCAAATVWFFSKLGLHKQVVNRLVSPWSFTEVVVTGNQSAWANFLALRADSHADPALQKVAYRAAFELANSRPDPLSIGDWHLPFTRENRPGKGKAAIIQSVARCARVSYKSRLNGLFDSHLEEDEKLYERLLGCDPKHASPSEHQACAVISDSQGGNLGMGWMQFRKTLAGEVRSDLTAELKRLGY